jgi:AcrR family transcriptional regulator
MSNNRPAEGEPPAEDGRRLRSERNRQKIVEAMLELVHEGNYDPSVAQIAERAEVGLRTVFRHFDDVDSLYREIATRMEARILPEVGKPLNAEAWPDRVKELLARRSRVFDEIMPVRICARVRRFRSEFLLEQHKRFVAQETAGLALALPPEVLENESLRMAFDVALSFDTWRRLRLDQNLSRAKAMSALDTLLDALIASA